MKGVGKFYPSEPEPEPEPPSLEPLPSPDPLPPEPLSPEVPRPVVPLPDPPSEEPPWSPVVVGTGITPGVVVVVVGAVWWSSPDWVPVLWSSPPAGVPGVPVPLIAP